jgi:hypothetical protein
VRAVRPLVLACALATLLGVAPAVASYDPSGEYLDFADRPAIERDAHVSLDPSGIPTVEHNGSWHYNPVTIAQYGLQQWSFYARDGGSDNRSAAVRAADWLVAHQAAGGRWEYDFEHTLVGIDVTLIPPWISAMAQGEAMSLLTRVWRDTGENGYLTTAQAALEPFRHAPADGGVAAAFLGDESHRFYEEYPTQPSSFTLNGFMFSLFGLYDLGQADPAGDSDELFGAGLETLELALPHYDTGGVSAYHLGHLTNPPRPVYASLGYHWIHVMQLAALDSIAPNPTLETYHDRWAAYKPPSPPHGRKAPRPVVPPPRPVLPPPEPAAALPPATLASAKLVRRPRPGSRRIKVRVRASRPTRVTLRLWRSVKGKWRRRGGASKQFRTAGAHTIDIARHDHRRLGRARYRVRISAGSSIQVLRVRIH